MRRAFAKHSVAASETFSDVEEDGQSSLYSDATTITVASYHQSGPPRPTVVPPLNVVSHCEPSQADQAHAAAVCKAGVRSRAGDLECHSPDKDMRAFPSLGHGLQYLDSEAGQATAGAKDIGAANQASTAALPQVPVVAVPPTQVSPKKTKKSSTAKKLKKALTKFFAWKVTPGKGMPQLAKAADPDPQIERQPEKIFPPAEESGQAAHRASIASEARSEPASMHGAGPQVVDAMCAVTCSPPAEKTTSQTSTSFLPVTPPMPQHYEELDLGEGAIFKVAVFACPFSAARSCMCLMRYSAALVIQ